MHREKGKRRKKSKASVGNRAFSVDPVFGAKPQFGGPGSMPLESIQI